MVIAPEHELINSINLSGTTPRLSTNTSPMLTAAVNRERMAEKKYYRAALPEPMPSTLQWPAHPDMDIGICIGRLWYRGHYGGAMR